MSQQVIKHTGREAEQHRLSEQQQLLDLLGAVEVF